MKTRLFPILAICALAASPCTAGDADFKREQGDKLTHLEGKDAPQLHVEGWMNTEPLSLPDLKGKVVVIDFWGVW